MTEQAKRKQKGISAQKLTVLGIVVFFSAVTFYSSVISPETGEKILYGKNPPGKNISNLEYSEIILSKDYSCMESASSIANGKLSKFVEEFNRCHGN